MTKSAVPQSHQPPLKQPQVAVMLDSTKNMSIVAEVHGHMDLINSKLYFYMCEINFVLISVLEKHIHKI